MSRAPFGDPPLSRRVIGFITLAASTDGNRSSIGTSTIPQRDPLCNHLAEVRHQGIRQAAHVAAQVRDGRHRLGCGP